MSLQEFWSYVTAAGSISGLPSGIYLIVSKFREGPRMSVSIKSCCHGADKPDHLEMRLTIRNRGTRSTSIESMKRALILWLSKSSLYLIRFLISPVVELLASFVCITSFIVLLASELSACAWIFSTVTDLPYLWLIIVFGFMILAYTFRDICRETTGTVSTNYLD